MLPTAPVVREQEPNNTPQQAQKISLPCEVVGLFNPRGVQDWFQFDAHKGDAWTIEVYSQRLGLSTDPYLLVQRVSHPEGKPETMVDVAESDDPAPEKRQEHQSTFLNMEFDDPTGAICGSRRRHVSCYGARSIRRVSRQSGIRVSAFVPSPGAGFPSVAIAGGGREHRSDDNARHGCIVRRFRRA